MLIVNFPLICFTMQNVGGRIRALRLEREMSLPALADTSGLSKGLLSKLENSEAPNPSLETLQKIAKALTVTLSDLLESGKIQARRIVPDSPPEWLNDLQSSLRRDGQEVDEDILQALYVLQARKGNSHNETSSWYVMYKNLEANFRDNMK